MLLNLIVCKLKYLKTISESRLRGFSFSKIINNLLIRKSLLNIIIIKIHYCVSIRKYFSFNAIVEDHFLFTVLIHSLNLSIIANHLFNNFHVDRCLIMILRWEFHIKVLFFLIRIRCFLFLLLLLLGFHLF